jgi:glycosyltransferase involved in cell wall biosynthesis
VTCQVLYAAAHAGFADTEPLGGGKAVADHLEREWRRDRPFPLRILSPTSLGVDLPRPLAAMNEREYARFSRQFGAAVTRAVREHPPEETIVLSNDIAEGPDFAVLAASGYRLATIVHVDVVEYFNRFYLRSLLPVSVTARLGVFPWWPGYLRLVFRKQWDCVSASRRLIVPSDPVAGVLAREYPKHREKLVVLPWGNLSGGEPEEPPLDPGIGADEFLILTMSRLSPEKGIERLLRALPLVIAGGAAYMRGRRYEQELRRLAGSVRGISVEFAGHVTGSRKAGLLGRADLFVSSSLHESYGLALAEAIATGCPVISHAHYGATGEVIDCRNPVALGAAISAHVRRGRPEKRPSAEPVSAAARVAEVLMAMG